MRSGSSSLMTIRSNSGRRTCFIPLQAYVQRQRVLSRCGLVRPMHLSMFDLDAALRHLVEAGGSDLHLKVPSKPLIRLDGELVAIPDSVELDGDTTMGCVRQMLDDEPKLAEFETEREVDFAYAIRGLARFRVNAFTSAARCRWSSARSRSTSCTIEELDLPPVDPRPRRRGARDRAGHRHDRLGQVDDARGDDRPHQLDEVASTSSRSRTRSSSCTGQALGHQPARGRVRHRRRSSARCAASCARTRT